MFATLKYFIPSLYFIQTRLNKTQDLVFHVYYEFIASFLILFFLGGYDLLQTCILFGVGYFSFISIYELGYLLNDYYSIRQEKNPNKRLGEADLSVLTIFLFVVIRLGVFAGLVWYWNLATPLFSGFYLLMSVSFLLHNVIKNVEVKLMTFVCLAYFRFIAIFFPFIEPERLRDLLPSILLFYVLYRSLNYLDSKKLLTMSHKKSIPFKIQFYLLLLPVSIFLCLVQGDALSIIANGYFLGFWSLIFIVARNKNL